MNSLNLSRREFLRVGAIGGLAVAEALGGRGAGAAEGTRPDVNCICLFLRGGMSHLDLWDLKPDAPAEIRGDFSPIDSAVPGILISELLPRTARVTDKLAILRSVTHAEPDHERAIALMAGRVASVGSSNESGLGPDNDRNHRPVELPANCADVDGAARDVGLESASTRLEYGRTSLGQSCLRARQLVEAGCRHVRIECGHWDTHRQNGWCLKELLAPSFDQAFPALLTDLDQRGLLDSTLVIATTEFGRTPLINSLLGRDHWPNAFSVVMAGAGVKPGQVVGSTDRHGACIADRPVTPAALSATIRRLLPPSEVSRKLLPAGREIARRSLVDHPNLPVIGGGPVYEVIA